MPEVFDGLGVEERREIAGCARGFIDRTQSHSVPDHASKPKRSRKASVKTLRPGHPRFPLDIRARCEVNVQGLMSGEAEDEEGNRNYSIPVSGPRLS